jgi:hypothetical protein
MEHDLQANFCASRVRKHKVTTIDLACPYPPLSHPIPIPRPNQKLTTIDPTK